MSLAYHCFSLYYLNSKRNVMEAALRSRKRRANTYAGKNKKQKTKTKTKKKPALTSHAVNFKLKGSIIQFV